MDKILFFSIGNLILIKNIVELSKLGITQMGYFQNHIIIVHLSSSSLWHIKRRICDKIHMRNKLSDKNLITPTVDVASIEYGSMGVTNF